MSISVFNFQVSLQETFGSLIKPKGHVYCPKENMVKASSMKSTAT